MKKISFILFVTTIMMSCSSPAQKKEVAKASFKITKTDAEWKQQLSPMAYQVMRKNGTERAFSSELNDNYKKGMYVCAACENQLFLSDRKFDSGTGWPSFDRPIEGGLTYTAEKQMGYNIVEEHCAQCGGHIGHVFDDGPKETTGKRHCTNGVALKFIPADEERKR